MKIQGRALPDDELMTLDEAAEHVGLSVRTLRRYQSSGRLAVMRVGRRIMCTREAVEQAVRDGGLELASRRMADASWDDRPVREWMGAWIDYTNLAPQDTQPPERYVRYMTAASEQYGDLPVREYRLEHLKGIHDAAVEGGYDVPEVAMMLVLPHHLPVIEAVRQMQVRFSGRRHDGNGRGDSPDGDPPARSLRDEY
ncbi:MAG: helix-turn-helix domain-containing protein [Planctomycetota bacterium]|jgi:excisionase family DNA binding protein